MISLNTIPNRYPKQVGFGTVKVEIPDGPDKKQIEKKVHNVEKTLQEHKLIGGHFSMKGIENIGEGIVACNVEYDFTNFPVEKPSAKNPFITERYYKGISNEVEERIVAPAFRETGAEVSIESDSVTVKK